jgi:iron(III) transport system substrate-binding protein
LARGRGTITLWNLPDAMLQKETYGYPFAYRIPDGGTPVLVDAIAVVAGAPHRELAASFYEFVTSPSMLAEMAHAFYRIPVREDLDRQTLPDWMRQPVRALPMDWERLSREGPRWMNVFDRRIKGRGREYLQETARRP